MEFTVSNENELAFIVPKILGATNKKHFLFEGEMGAGKTTLIKYMCSALGSTDEISSPSFSIVNHYKTVLDKNIFHFDFFRIKSPEEATNIGFEEYLEGDNYCFIEWPEIVSKLIFTDFVRVKIQAEDNFRKIKVDL